VVIAVVVVMVPVVVAATMLYFFELLVALVRLSAALAVALDRVAQLVFRLVNLSFTSFMPFVVVSVVRPRLEGRACQSDDCQQGNAKNSNGPSHSFSSRIVILSWTHLSFRRCGRWFSRVA
jgi:hypothetical protein